MSKFEIFISFLVGYCVGLVVAGVVFYTLAIKWSSPGGG